MLLTLIYSIFLPFKVLLCVTIHLNVVFDIVWGCKYTVGVHLRMASDSYVLCVHFHNKIIFLNFV